MCKRGLRYTAIPDLRDEYHPGQEQECIIKIYAPDTDKLEISVKEGTPVKVILDESANYDIIVMGTLGRTGMSKLLMGSVAERVVRASQCPVLVVRSTEGAN